MAQFELQFTEGFSGHRFKLLRGGEAVSEADLQTEFQTGLTHVEPIEAAEGEIVVICIDGMQDSEIKLSTEKPFVVISMKDGELQFEEVSERPGYL